VTSFWSAGAVAHEMSSGNPASIAKSALMEQRPGCH
jgi:hypothetical protein